MSILPHVLNTLLQDYNHRQWLNELNDQPLALGLTPVEILQLVQRPNRSGNYMNPWRVMSGGDTSVTTFSSNKNEFKVNLDVQQFKPDELKIQVTDDYLVVDGKHEERSDEHGFISRQFTRRYKIPVDVNREKLSSNLSSDGVLSITAPKIVKEEVLGREIPIIRTNQPAAQQSTAQKQEQKGEEKKEETTMES